MLQQRLILRVLILTVLLGILQLAAGAQTTPEPLDDEATLTLLADTGLTILPLERVTETAPTLQDLSATSVRVNFISSIPLGCIVVYGEARAFGNATQDPGMTGATMIEHNPVLTGLEPETDYVYRLQGSDVHGNLYVSPVYTFRTPALDTTISENLLSPERGATIVDVSSNWGNQPDAGSTWGVANAFDDDPNTAWSSNGDGDDAFVVVALGQRAQIDTLYFWTRTMSNNTAQIYSFTVTDEAGQVYGPFELPDPDQAYEFAVDIEADTLRFDVVSSNGGNTGAVDIAAYGTPLGD